MDKHLMKCFKEQYDPQNESANWKLLVKDKELSLINEALASKISKKFAGQKIVVAVILKGAAYFYTDLTRNMSILHSSYFIEASSYKDEQTQCEEIELLSKIIPSKFEGRKVILIDELYDNGATMFKVKEKILSEVPSLKEEDIFTCVMFLKDKDTKYTNPDLFGLKIPNVWVVGYGLDDKQEKRNWIHLFAKPKDDGVKESEHDKIFTDEDYYNEVRNNIIDYVYDI